MRNLLSFFVLLLLATSFIAAAASRLACNDYFVQSLSTAEKREHSKILSVAKNWQKVSSRDYGWRNWIDDTTMFKRFINPPYYESQIKAHKHAMEMYPNILKQYHAFKAGNEFLMSIPLGDFQITEELIKNLHKVIMKGVYRLDEKILDTVIPGTLFVAAPGKYKGHTNFGFNPLTKNPLTDSQYQAVMDNPDIKFMKFPLISSKGSHRGLMVFPGRSKIKQGITDLIAWYNSNKGNVDPVYLAATFQRRFVSLHPFYNGNGRTSRMLMNRILHENGLPPSIVSNQNWDTYINNDPLRHDEIEWTKIVAEGLRNYIKDARKVASKFKKRVLYKQVPFVSNKDHGVYLAKEIREEYSHLVSENLFPSNPHAEFKIGKDKFIIFKDGFFYNNKGIPHVLKGSELYPIADKTLTLYGLSEERIKGQLLRDYSKSHEGVIQEHFALLNKIENKSIDLNTLKVHPYEVIEKANNRNQYFIYPWQKELLKDAVVLDDMKPFEILSPSRGGFTGFERVSHQNARVKVTNISTVVAQYQRMDLQFRELRQFVKKNAPELLSELQRSREKLHQAGRHYIDKFNQRLAELPQDQAQFYKNHPEYRLLQEYLVYTPLNYQTLAEADKSIGESIYLLRSDISSISRFGFFAEEQLHNLLTRLPFSEKFIPKLRAKYKDAPKGSKEHMFYDKVLMNPYQYRGVDKEFDRALVDFYLHSLNDGGKKYVSFSTRVDQYLSADGKLSFEGVKDTKYSLHIVKVPENRAFDNFASGWLNQYEVVTKPLGFWRTKKTFKDPRSYFMKLPEESLMTEQQKKWMKEYESLRKFDFRKKEDQ